MNNHTEDKDEFYRKSVPLAKMYVDEFLTNTIHNNAIQSCIDVVRELYSIQAIKDGDTTFNVHPVPTEEHLISKLNNLKK